MSYKRLNTRISHIDSLGMAALYCHDLRFHKASEKDGSGKCDIFQTNNPEHVVLGVLYKIDPMEKPILDRYEGLGYGYEIKQVNVKMKGDLISAFTYYATHIDQELMPLGWYKEHVLRGARENGLPEDYVRKIERVDSIDDYDSDRHRRELEIYSLV